MAQLVGGTSIDPLQSAIQKCTLCADLLSVWARFSCAPDTDVVSWLTEGVPAGTLDHPRQMDVFPDAVEAADIMDRVDGDFEDPALRVNYASVEEDDYALSELDRLFAAGFIKKFATLDLCAEFLGCAPVVSKFVLVIGHRMRKEKPAHHFAACAGRGVRRADLGR